MIRKHSIRIPVLRNRSHEPLLAAFIGAAVAMLIVFSVFGCKDMPNTATALDAANKALVAVDVAADTAVEGVKLAREERIAACRAQNLPTPEQREACLGPLAEPLEPKAQAAGDAYDAAVEALQALADAIAAIEELKQ